MESDTALNAGEETVLPASSAATAGAAPSRTIPAESRMVIEKTLDLPEGAAQMHVRVEAPTGTDLRIELETRSADGRLVGHEVFGEERQLQVVRSRLRLPRLALRTPASALALSLWLTWLSLGVYIFVRLVALPSYPIYFFTDEAVQTVLAADMLRDGLRSYSGEILPTYLQNGSQYNLSASVYLQVLPYYLFGKSIWVTRGAAALVTLLAAVSVALMLKRVYHSPYPWLGVFFLSATPAWFLHSRTAFETALATTFYAAFLYSYLMYRREQPRYLYGAVAFGAFTFYAYTPMRVVIGVTALMLLVSDARFHWQNRWLVLRGFTLACLLALPFIRFLLLHPQASEWQMRLLGSYWLLDISAWEKAQIYLQEYLRGLSPSYWYLSHKQDLPRHVMQGYGHLLRPTLPLLLLGMGLALRKLRLPEYRVLLIALLAAPSGAAVVKLGITRALVMVIPAAILTALAASALLEWLRAKRNLQPALLALPVFALLAGANLFILADALTNGPIWHQNYGLNGMQYGSQQLFGTIRQILAEQPDTQMVVSPSWANGTDVIARFFFNDPLPFHLGSVSDVYKDVRLLPENNLFVMIPEEYAEIPRDHFREVEVKKVLPYPNGRPGFYFVRLQYVENIAEVIAAEKEAHLQPQLRELSMDGQAVRLEHSLLDIGQAENLFDGDPDSLVRSWAINPMQLNFTFPQPRPLQSVTLRIGGTATTVALTVWSEADQPPVELTLAYAETIQPRNITLELPASIQARRVLLLVMNTNDPPDGHVHLWEIQFQ